MNASATLSAGGTVGTTGNGTAILKTGALTLASTSIYAVDLNSNTVGTGYDQTSVTGTVMLTGSTLNVTLGYTPASSDVFVLIDNDGTDAITGTFASTTGVPSGFSLDYTYNSSTGLTTGGNDLALIAAVPEPTTWLAGLIALGTLGYSQRRNVRCWFGSGRVVAG